MRKVSEHVDANNNGKPWGLVGSIQLYGGKKSHLWSWELKARERIIMAAPTTKFEKILPPVSHYRLRLYTTVAFLSRQRKAPSSQSHDKLLLWVSILWCNYFELYILLEVIPRPCIVRWKCKLEFRGRIIIPAPIKIVFRSNKTILQLKRYIWKNFYSLK